MTRVVSLLLALLLWGALPAVAAPSAVDWAAPGPHAVTSEATATHTIYRPSPLTQRHPVIIWGNGTGAAPSLYAGLLQHWASYGFIVAAANTPNSGSGKEMLAGITYLTAEDSRPGSLYFGHVDLNRIGASGHSQGGGGAIAAGADPRIRTTVPIQPGPLGGIEALHSPMFILSGQLDVVVLPLLLVLPRYNAATHIPAVYGELAGATHTTPTGNGGGYRGATTAWFRLWLADDPQARSEFLGSDTTCGLCTSPAWSDVRRNPLIPRT
ncbi:acetylxylan esterase [Kibdelosporangium philippinense]|uniref:Acetylxylan esterase n=1 Tax=Kibdelosporangium philippinense TaxID=211113 RepID=A0ABS8YZR0_9PSEU|nr:acetylxylan esterase [Kibdelosporangium philippinense]MCE7001231.1 acetylxylan esterase [Kibdelosporangium philippinense]